MRKIVGFFSLLVLFATVLVAPAWAGEAVAPPAQPMFPLGVPEMSESCGQPLPALYSGVGVGGAPPKAQVQGVTLPKIDSAPPPEKADVQGKAQVLVVVCKDGSVGYAATMKAPSQEMAEAAAQAVSRWKFHPATKGGEPVAVKYTVAVQFTDSK